MAASGRGRFESLTRRHGVKINTRASVQDCSLAIGEIIGHDKIISAARMNSAVVLFLETVDLANAVVESGVVIDGTFTTVFPLSSPSKKVIISNVPPFVKDEVLMEILSRFGKLISPIRKIAISTSSPQLKHVVSFRRFVYMTLSENRQDLDLTLNVTVDGFVYPIYVSSCLMKCFGCGQTGHLARACPERKDGPATDGLYEKEGEKKSSDTNASTGGEGTVEGALAEGEGVVLPPEPSSPPHSTPTDLDGVESVRSEDIIASSVCTPPDNIVDDDKTYDNDAEDESSQMEADEVDPTFKVPRSRHKGRRSQPHDTAKNKSAKVHSKAALVETESEFDSDCSVSCSMRPSGYVSQSYNIDDIKKFLTQTKHAKKLQIDKYFPDVEQFISKAKLFMAEGLVTKQEGYRLRKFVTKLNVLLGSTDEQ
ncbi:hypothetical protein ACEWY4_017388 [Coilia grayii]|uniref:CCHC-type domain-containing protein n=1 Tax=Coilia grayii TaxID=363190 RepID=A0ABD1JGQ0_9TELE